ncbi:MAG: xanthine dehydrogenase family protein molybdopterin-binding subunit [Bacillota bacterium]|nr:xanthine dehydrogenase family protein molybdopterin-binding subunit [Bacillota bacterium]
MSSREPAYQVIGKSQPRLDGPEKLRGSARYVADLRPAHLLHARLVLSPHPHARIVRIDATGALQTTGVVAVLTAADLEPTALLAEDEVFYVGHPVAVVVAESEALAEDAAERVQVEYEPLPAVLDPEQAMLPDAPLVRRLPEDHASEAMAAHGAATASAQDEPRPQNVSDMVHFRRGDVAAGFAQADAVIEATYRAGAVHQGHIETHGVVAEPGPDGSLTLWTSTQGSFDTRHGTAQTLGLEEHRIRVVPTTVGGAFGGKFMLLEPLAGAVARRLGRTVRLVLDRVQDFLVSRPAPAAVIRLKMGARRDGSLTALQARLVFDTGAEPGSPVGIAALLLGGTYRVPHLEIVGYEVLTHKSPAGAYRGPGAPQAYFALESHMDRLARRLGLDPLEFRLQNAAREGDPRPDGRSWPRLGLVECLERVREHPLWQEKPAGPDEGWGLAVGGWPGGLEPAAAGCRLDPDGTLTVQVGAVDITGSATSLAMIAAEIFGLPPERVQVVNRDTDSSPFGGSAGGSKTIYTIGPAVQRAAEDARRQVLELAAERLEAAPEDLELRDGRVSVKGVPSRSVTLAELARLTTRFGSRYAPIYGHGRVAQRSSAPGFAVHLARVHVDRETGQLRVTGYLAVQDVGRAINPAEVVGQIRGGVTQGIGRAFLEELIWDESGQLADANLADYRLPTVSDVPPIEAELVEVPAPDGPFGAKGVGEPPAIPVAAALANALEDAVGVRLERIPFHPAAVLEALGQADRRTA